MARQPKPMDEWLNQPRNQRMFEQIEDDVHLMYREGRFNDPQGSLDPDKYEAERNQRKLSLTEQLIQEAPDEYLTDQEIKDRRNLCEPSASTSPESRQ